MIYDKVRILSNLHIARNIIHNLQPALFDLSKYKAETDCGTFYCSAGELTRHAHFREQGMVLYPEPTGRDCYTWSLKDLTTDAQCMEAYGGVDNNREGDGHHLWLEELFGENAWLKLFAPRKQGYYDKELIYAHVRKTNVFPTDRDLALARFDEQIKFINNAL